MPKLLVFQHVAYEILGTLDPLLRRHGFRIKYVNFGRAGTATPSVDGYHGLVVLGGPMNVDQVDEYPHLADEVQIVQRAIERGMPVLGICLGAQLIAKALGAPVRRNPEKEIGWYHVRPTDEARGDPLLGHLGEEEKIFQWHGDTFDLPGGAVHLASSDRCANQAFRFGDRVYGLQFHLEVDDAIVKRWLGLPALIDEVREMGHDTDRIFEDTDRYIARSRALSDRVFRAFIDLFEGARPRDPHPHG